MATDGYVGHCDGDDDDDDEGDGDDNDDDDDRHQQHICINAKHM